MANQCKHAALAVVFPSGVNKTFFCVCGFIESKTQNLFFNYFYIDFLF